MRMLLATVLAIAVAAPVVVTGAATGVTQNTATLTGTVNPQGDPTTYFFEYGTTTAYGLQTPPQSAGDGSDPASVEVDLSGLTGNTTYHYRLVAFNDSSPEDRVLGQDRTFTTTPNPLPPGISNQRVRDVGVDAARLTATLDPNGSATTYHFEYGTSTRYGSRTPEQSAGSGTSGVPVSAPITGLAARTTYNWRLVATNAAGTMRGRNRRFTTARLPTAVSLSLSPRFVPWGASVALGGRVSGAGVDGTPLALQRQRFPFDTDFTEVARASAGRDGGYLFRIANLWESTRFRVVTRTPVAAISPVVVASSVVRAGARARHVSRRRARIEGSSMPAAHALVRLQRRSPSRRWRTVKSNTVAPADAVRTRYRFSVRRQRRTRRYRIVVRPLDNGAHATGRSRTVKVRARPR
jgi:hypothetical protein